jgi:hypothetical protein
MRKNTTTYAAAILSLFLFSLNIRPDATVAASDPDHPLLQKVIFGIFLHDRGPTSDRHESGVDPNLEIQLNPPAWKYWRWIGSPAPMAGLTPNFNGDTSVFYAGLNYEFSLSNHLTDELTFNLTKNLFVAGGLSAALHTGPLHKNDVLCDKKSDCGFGYRVLPRLNVELGTRLWGNHGLALFYDHMSHKGVLPGENEGLDHVGIRFHYRFGPPKS